MFTAVYLANNINTDWRITFHYFNIAMAVMIATIFYQYLFTLINEVNDKREFLFILGIEFFLIILGLMLGYYVGIYFCIAAYIIGLILPIFLWEKFKSERVNFPHLVERVSLIVIIAFGEVIVNLANYFNSKTPLMYAAFLLLVLMFASYVLLSDKIINHHQISRGFVLMYSHIAIVISVLLMTVDTLYLNNKNVDHKFLYGLIIGTVALYYFSLIVNQVYSKKVCQFKKIEAITLLTIFIIGALILWLVKNSNFVGYDLLINMKSDLFLSFSNEKQKFFKLTLL
ncbi:low temperature requirement protein A [Lactobacillus johnsonii]|uniref:Low temperature requirement protein A n=1 Tax=Lactobacillus johnsonii TaxID=33959 RepID=A0A9X7TWL8_LACJH|nr:low temperature requirement protein A [Lactobacillus johnsonii]QLL67930.1 low temperature requirement protein A [Lactobacillus johnsonii]